jgi:cytochrome c553
MMDWARTWLRRWELTEGKMGRCSSAFLLVLLPGFALAADAPPDWAFLARTPGIQPAAEDLQPKHVVGSTKTYTQKEIDDIFNPPDWYPNEHPPMPELVSRGKPPIVHGCAQCHLTSGRGHPESANLAGLPVGYIEEQLAEFRNGSRAGSLAGPSIMATFAKALSDEEVKPAAEYFSSIKPSVWTKVVETDTLPKSYVGEGNMRFVAPGGAREPLGRRIIELPSNEEGAKSRDPHSPFVAYVPPGSIKAGEDLVATGGGGKTIQCTICHGSDLKGLGNVPGLAGRSAIYIFRQLYDIQHGARKGNAVALMQPVVAKLSQDDMIALAAYAASRNP